MLLRLLRSLRLINKREYAKVIEEQYAALKERRDEAFDAGASREARVLTARLSRKRLALDRAKRAAGMVALCLFVSPSYGCATAGVQDAMELAAVASNKALKHCERKMASGEGDESQSAQESRLRCLRLPDLEGRMDAVDAIGYELEQARYWVLTGRRP